MVKDNGPPSKKPFENVLIMKFKVGYPVKIQNKRIREEYRLVDRYLIMLVKVDDHWHTFNSSFASYGKSIAYDFSQDIQRAYDNQNLDAEVTLRGDIIDSKMPTVLERFLDKMIERDGIILENLILREMESAYVVLYFSNDNYEYVSKYAVELILDTENIGEIIYLGPIFQENNLPFYYTFLKKGGFDLSNFRLLRTRWVFEGNQINEKVDGLFSNKGLYFPKYFSNNKVNLYMIQENNVNLKKGNCRVVEKRNDLIAYECREDSDWFRDFYDNIISGKVGPVSMWWESDGEKYLENYYVMYDSLSMIFLAGLKQLFEMEKRKDHVNILSGSRLLEE